MQNNQFTTGTVEVDRTYPDGYAADGGYKEVDSTIRSWTSRSWPSPLGRTG